MHEVCGGHYLEYIIRFCAFARLGHVGMREREREFNTAAKSKSTDISKC